MRSILKSFGATAVVALFLLVLFVTNPNHPAFRDEMDEQIRQIKNIAKTVRRQLAIPERRPMALFRILEAERTKLVFLLEHVEESQPTNWQKWKLQKLLSQFNELEEELKLIIG